MNTGKIQVASVKITTLLSFCSSETELKPIDSVNFSMFLKGAELRALIHPEMLRKY